ncbi:glycosyltransferase [Acinetobacter rathckeae]|uniref:glycosyltransferase n=1 Tax=Acinetobacter rathckeae TaxID=2605272 RepID=UPI0018A297E9|nr:glycosyltransferase [Acinetobacter rathckeae]MBF7688802.1 glycosyltransferase [Acinetobacter rathckeae]MBF7696279.1 glycosyltransferase [Acinetobacter rathckeae]
MKVLLLITGLGLGGAENVVLSLATQLIQRGHEVKIAYLKGQVTAQVPEHIELCALGLDSMLALPKVVRRFKQLLKDFQPDVVHAHLFHAIIFTRIMRKLCVMPRLICTAHSKAIGGTTRRMLYRYTDALADVNSNVSHEATQYFIAQRAFSAQRSVTVTNGIDTGKFRYNDAYRTQYRQQYGLSEQDVVFMAIGRFNIAKDYANLIHAFAKCASLKHKKLFIIGDGELREQISDLIIQQQLTEQVILLGRQFHVEHWLSMADIFVLSSAWEGFGLVVAEAMSCERVVVATDCGGVKEVLASPHWLVPPKNSQALADKLREASALSEHEKQHIGQQHRQQIEANYSLTRMCDDWLAIYQKNEG